MWGSCANFEPNSDMLTSEFKRNSWKVVGGINSHLKRRKVEVSGIRLYRNTGERQEGVIQAVRGSGGGLVCREASWRLPMRTHFCTRKRDNYRLSLFLATSYLLGILLFVRLSFIILGT